MNTGTPGIEAVLFDFMGVLLFLRSGYAGDETVDAVDDMIGGVIDDEAFRSAVRKRFGIDEEEFQGILARIPGKYEAYEPLWKLLPVMRKKYKLAIINNGTRLTFPYFDAGLKLTGRFDAILSSGAEGVRKPEREIYLRAARRLGIAPAHCLFMDDSETNIRGAQEAGMQTVYWENREAGFERFLDRMRSDGMEF